jgi:hypothetical protein
LYFPLSAQQIQIPKPKTIKLEFGVGAKALFPSRSLLTDLTNNNMGYGGFIEGRLLIGLSRGHSWLRLRAGLDDWGQNAYKLDRQYRSGIRRVRSTLGLGYCNGFSPSAELYVGVDFGINHWDIDSTHPLFGKEDYYRLAGGFSLGVQFKHLFLELGVEIDSMDDKGTEGEYFGPGIVNPMYPPEIYHDARPGICIPFAVGWRF